MKRIPTFRTLLLAGFTLFPAADYLFAQEDGDAPVYELSPFEVTTTDDDRYYASNAISGSRLDVRIQDMPLTIEVLTSEFVEDTGATDLRESLRYSAGILLQSQNDAYQAGTDKFGNVNNPEGATSAKSQSSFKIRGFVTNNTLRNGFRRQHATDTVNIDRVEVIRGPSALLYGVGNFGGVVNYLTKRPLDDFQGDLQFAVGTDNFRRASIDVTGPMPLNFGYRLTAAVEDTDDWTELNNHNHWFVSPVLQWKWNKTKLTVDLEVGDAEDNAIGFKSVRAPTLEGVGIFDTDRLETYGFLEFEGEDPRTFRWSGPDTYLDTESWNGNIELEQELIEDMYLLVGYNHSEVKFQSRDVFGGIQTYTSPAAAPARAQPLLNTIEAIQIIDGASSDVRIPVDNAVLRYNWTGAFEDIEWDQVRAEMTYTRELFDDSSLWRSEHNLLAGFSWEEQTNSNVVYRLEDSPDGDNFYYKDPTDSSYIRFDSPTDGSPVLPFEPDELNGGVSANTGLYAVYSGRFFKDKLFVVAGIREDTTSSEDGYYELLGSRQGRISFPDSEVKKRTNQYGISYEVIDGLTVYGLQAEGVEPNFDGQRDGLGRALESSVAEATEFGVKVNLFDGKIAATVSMFEIERDGLPFSYWWAPAPARGAFNPSEDIVYRMDEWNLDDELETENPNRYLLAAREEWEAAKAAEAVYPAENPENGTTYTYLNASMEEGAAYLDAVFEALKAEFAKPREERTDQDPWAGWLFVGIEDTVNDPNLNFATLDNSSGDYFQSISDKSEGWEAQVIWTPNDVFQLILNYSHVEREVTQPGTFVEYPYAEGNWDRWASWYFPNSNWGLGGANAQDVYPGGEGNLPNRDTSTWTGIGWGKGQSLDDTPEHAVSWWARYDFKNVDRLEGLQVGLGGSWQSKREYASQFTSAGQRKQNETGTTIKAFTDDRLTINAMAKYTWTIFEKDDAFVQINVDNVLDDDDQYGLIYAPGRSGQVRFGIKF
jgi:outer membrane receptor protein involved in Fe transport